MMIDFIIKEIVDESPVSVILIYKNNLYSFL